MIRLAIQVGSDPDGIVLAELLALSPGGVQEHDGAKGLEYVIYGAPGELPALPDSELEIAGRRLAIKGTEIADDWDERWKRWHRPVVVRGRTGRAMRVRPPWEPALGEGELVIDPGQAFGTGAHATTRLCLELLLDMETPPGALADWGCGTGVLAIAAVRLGYDPVVAVDYDPLAVEATRVNAAANGASVQAAAADLHDGPLPWAPTVCANLLRPLLLECARTLVDPPETLIASGLLDSEADAVAQAFAVHGLRERDRRHADGWCALRLAG